ncbi:hypothetical protein V8D89_009202 [Ganoderma adspersum]
MLTSLPPEVLDAICHALGRPFTPVLRSHPRQGLKTLASLARTSRLLHEPAVNAIWRTITNTSDILHTLPDDLWIETGIPVPDPDDPGYVTFEMQLSFKRQTVQSDFTRLKHYAHRIQHITHANTYLITSDVLEALAIHFPPGSLFPNIQSLSYTSTESEAYRLLPLLIGPKLRSLRLIGPAPSQIDAEHPNADPLDCLRVLPHTCPLLSELTTRMDLKTNIPHVNVISGAIPGFQDLASVLVPGIPLDFPAIMHLAKLRNLKTLNAYLSPEITEEDYKYLTSTSTDNQVYFPSLRRINLKNRFLALCTSLLKVVSSPVLEAVTFTTVRVFGFLCTTEDVSELCAELSRYPTLTSIAVAVRSMLHGGPLTRATFAPLLALSSLTVLDVDIGHPINVDDAFLAEMAHAWRRITRLELCVQNPFWSTDGYDPAATLSGLVPFARLCPALEVLGVPVREDLSSLSHAALERRPFHADGVGGLGGASESVVCELEVGLSVVRARWVAPVAAFLSDVFPELTGISTAWTDAMGEDMSEDMDGDVGTPEEIRARWDEVARLARRFGNVRRQERNWVAVHGDAHGEWAEEEI